MKEYKILRVSNAWSTNKLQEEAQKLINQKNSEGWEVVSVSFGYTIWLVSSLSSLCQKQSTFDLFLAIKTA